MPALDDQKQEQFCQAVFKGKSDLQAYVEAYSATVDTAHANAWRVRALEGVSFRISELLQRVEDKNVLSMAEKRLFLANIVRTSVGDVTEKSPLCQSYKIGKDGVEYKMPGKLEAVKLDALLAGELRESSAGGGTVINIALLGQPPESQ